MNPLPQDWHASMQVHPDATALVLLDGAMQQEIGSALARDSTGARSLMPEYADTAARQAGAWLIDATRAHDAGIDGIGRGVSWVLSRTTLETLAEHFREWSIQPLPDGTERGYLRIADARVFRALARIWTRTQWQAFRAPLLMLCCADRDHGPVMLNRTPSESKAGPSHVDPRLDDAQYAALLEASIPDQLLHEVKTLVTPHASFASAEKRHALACALLDRVRSEGIDDPLDWITLLAWSLVQGEPIQAQAFAQPPVVNGIRGAELWHALMSGKR